MNHFNLHTSLEKGTTMQQPASPVRNIKRGSAMSKSRWRFKN
ncbi:hypothetical protein M7I_0854 [Glarea lozoyensis 74030]|uniref:Uncharacterized protein n=1 Tax=Glarea lozoyensis (strain ATCC 74030 / MF5533) TaxID=1104152 RepID=H0EEH7_GLAL7|nr:hypothetical protein M7I_0854 [Glarea lozoyensis 74030]